MNRHDSTRARLGIHSDYTDEDKRKTRLVEQPKAAHAGEYACQIQLGFTSTEVEDRTLPVADHVPGSVDRFRADVEKRVRAAGGASDG